MCSVQTHGDAGPGDLVAIENLVHLISTRLDALYNMTITVEETLSQALNNPQGIDQDTIRILQQLDFARQSLKDLHALMSEAGDSMTWKSDQVITFDKLAMVVDMQSSLTGLRPENQNLPASTDEEIWL